jgi:hypothetical protein
MTPRHSEMSPVHSEFYVTSIAKTIPTITTNIIIIHFEREETKSRNIDIFLSPWNRVLFEKLIVTQLVKKFAAFYGLRRFITVFTRAGH